MTDKINNENLEEVSGGSWFITEADGKAVNLILKNEDGSPGSWCYLWNTGDYYWHDQKLTKSEANAIVQYYKANNKKPDSLQTALDFASDVTSQLISIVY